MQFACQMQLALNEAPGRSMVVDEYMSCTDLDSGADIKVRFPHHGLYHLAIHARPSTSKPTDSFYNVFNYFISIPENHIKSDDPVLPFPQPFSTWQDSFNLETPNSGLLVKDTKIKFSVKLPGVQGVSVVRGEGAEHSWTSLVNTGSDVWQAPVDTEQANSLQLCATFSDKQGGKQRSFSSLLQYQVLPLMHN